jgi:ERCC4-type nuclease
MIVDDREHDLIKRLNAEKVSFEVRRLPVGDIMFQHNGTTALVERKRTDDFAASISDGRWREQKARLATSGAIVIYLIEGSLYGQRKTPEVLSSAIWNTILRDKMCVIQTRGLEDTSLHLQQLEKKIGYTIKGNSGITSLVSKRKRKADNVFLLMLMTLPGISERIATAIVDKYSTLQLLQSQLRDDATILKEIAVSTKRNIGTKTIKTLCTFLSFFCYRNLPHFVHIDRDLSSRLSQSRSQTCSHCSS